MCESGECISVERFEAETARSMILGRAMGFESASSMLMKKAVTRFENEEDELARMLREFALDFKEKGEECREERDQIGVPE